MQNLINYWFFVFITIKYELGVKTFIQDYDIEPLDLDSPSCYLRTDRETDFQQQLFYKADKVLNKPKFVLKSLQDVREFINDVISSQFYQENFAQYVSQISAVRMKSAWRALVSFERYYKYNKRYNKKTGDPVPRIHKEFVHDFEHIGKNSAALAYTFDWTYHSVKPFVLAFTRGGYKKHIILHEISHLITAQVDPNTIIQAHGALFCRIYLELVEHFLGVKYQHLLITSFNTVGVAYEKK